MPKPSSAPPEVRYPHLFSPISLGPIELPHRVIIPGHSMVHGDSSGLITERYHEYLLTRAKGGAALVGIESAPVHPHSLTWTGQLELWRDEIIESLARTADAVHAAGSKLSIILWHGGHNVSSMRGAVALAPSAIPSVQIGEVPKVISVNEIRNLVGYYAAAAERCARAGVDVIEVQTASDYLLGSFLSPQLNHRTDGYGGSVGNRCRFVIEVLEAIRGRVPGQVAVGLRTSVGHAIPGDPEGYGIEESLPAMVTIANAGVTDYVSVMSGSNASFAETISPMSYPRVQLADQAARFKQALFVPVTVATASALFGDPELSLTGELPLVARRLRSAGIKIHGGTLVREVKADTAITVEGDILGPYDAMVLSMGAVANPVPHGVTPIGDCLAPRMIWSAVQDGARLALTL